MVVVGAGPSGCIAAKHAAEGGASTLVIEKDREVGIPVRCAGLISRRAIEESELREREVKLFTVNRIKGAVIHSPGYDLRIEAREHAYVIKRDCFDKALAEDARNSGAEIITGCRVVGIRHSSWGLSVEAVKAGGGREEIGAKVVIGADGVRAGVARLAGIKLTRNLLSCAQIEGCYDGESAYAEIFAGRRIAPGFFAWAIPLNDHTARIGLCMDDKFSSPHSTPVRLLTRLLSSEPHMVKRYRGSCSSHHGYTGGAIPIAAGLKLQKTVKLMHGNTSGILLVGDAAAQVKPITGGGVYYGLRSGKIAGEVAAKAVSAGDMHMLKDYERRWHKEIGKEIIFGAWVHRLRCVLDDGDLERILRALGRERRRVEEGGDMDYPSRILVGFIKKPEFIILGMKNIIRYILAIVD